MRMIKKSLFLGAITSLYFIPEIYKHSDNIIIFLFAYNIQIIHDAICILLILLISSCFKTHKNGDFEQSNNIIYVNILHSTIMICFCYYKRCVLTLLYNYILDIDMCIRYIPIWQRIFNTILNNSELFCYEIEEYKNTYLWLNNHIFQSLLVLCSNIYFIANKKIFYYQNHIIKQIVSYIEKRSIL